ncbi:kinase-like protein [Auricularia subglabra TFB-10046 SS5]|nr:kinase-like protein [Auricularia subglabra TFB-10046 SS5]
MEVTAFKDESTFLVELISAQPVDGGGSAKIFHGRIKRKGRAESVALKLFVNNVAEAHLQMLQRELRAVRQVRHEYILRYIGTTEFDFHTILVAPYMKNGNLLRYLSKNPNLDRRRSVADALVFLHGKHNLVHGDVKCENVLVSDKGRALLADFGLCTFMETTETSTRTMTGLRQQNSAQFAAPELILSEVAPRKTASTDVYAFGMMIIQVRTVLSRVQLDNLDKAFTGQPPWPGLGFPAITMKLFNREVHPRPENKVPPLGLDDMWWDVCIKCCDHDLSRRPAIGSALDALLEAMSRPYTSEDFSNLDMILKSLREQTPQHSPESLVGKSSPTDALNIAMRSDAVKARLPWIPRRASNASLEVFVGSDDGAF